MHAKMAGMRADRDELTKLLDSYREVEAKNNEFLNQKIEEVQLEKMSMYLHVCHIFVYVGIVVGWSV